MASKRKIGGLAPKRSRFAERNCRIINPWILIEAGAVRGRTMTSWPSLKTDLMNAGAEWVDQEVVANNGLITSRRPDDIPAFNRKMVDQFAEGKHSKQNVAN